MPNFIFIRIFKRFFKENLSFIINSFQIKHCSFKKNVRILAKSSRNIGKKRPGPQKFASPLKFAARPICQAWDLQPCPGQFLL